VLAMSSTIKQIYLNEKQMANVRGEAGTRILAFLLDTFFSIIGAGIVFFIFIGSENILDALQDRSTMMMITLSTMSLNLVLTFIIPVITNGQTFGKKIFGLRIVSVNGSDVSNSSLFFRYFILVVLSLFSRLPLIGFIFNLILFLYYLIGIIQINNDERSMTYLDKICNTVVVDDIKHFNLKNTIIST
jgi:uncharacterized RDD family membrane protein YckC